MYGKWKTCKWQDRPIWQRSEWRTVKRQNQWRRWCLQHKQPHRHRQQQQQQQMTINRVPFSATTSHIYCSDILLPYVVHHAVVITDQTSRCDLSWVESHEAFLSGKHILPNIAQQHLGQRTTPCCLDLQCISCLGLKKRTVISSALNAIGSEWNTDKERDEYNRPATATNAENFSFGCAINRN